MTHFMLNNVSSKNLPFMR